MNESLNDKEINSETIRREREICDYGEQRRYECGSRCVTCLRFRQGLTQAGSPSNQPLGTKMGQGELMEYTELQ